MPRTKKRAGSRRRGRPSLLATLPTSDLRHELERRQGMLQELLRQRDALSAELIELEGLFGHSMPMRNGRGAHARPAGKRGRSRGSGGRGGNKTNLVEALRATLTGKTMSVTEVAEAVQRNGYKTKSPNFRTIVNQALLANKSVFKKVARGQYTSK